MSPTLTRHCRHLASTMAAIASLAVMPSAAQAQADPIIGQIQYFAYDFCPVGWTLADGRAIDLSDSHNDQFQALFAYIGYTYGSSGPNVFNLPDARGRMLVHADTTRNPADLPVGTVFGSASTPVGQSNIPDHQHGVVATSASRNSPNLDNATFSVFPGIYLAYSTTEPSTETLSPATLAPTGQTSVDTAQPYLALRACIAYQGRWPSRGTSDDLPPGAEGAPGAEPPVHHEDNDGNILTRLGRWFSNEEEREDPTDPDPVYWDGLVTGDLLAMGGTYCPTGFVAPAGQWLSLENDNNRLLYTSFTNLYGYRNGAYRLPDLRQRVPISLDRIHQISQASAFGSLSVVLNSQNLQAHNHVMRATSQTVNDGDGTGAQLAAFLPGAKFYSNTPLTDENSLLMHSGMIPGSYQEQTFTPQPFSVTAPSLAINYCMVYYSEPAQRR